MDNKFRFTVDGQSVLFSPFKKEQGDKFCKARANIQGKYEVCPICKDLAMGGEVYVILGSHLFPNRICHKYCVDSFKTAKDAAVYLKNDYEKYLKYKHWDRS